MSSGLMRLSRWTGVDSVIAIAAFAGVAAALLQPSVSSVALAAALAGLCALLLHRRLSGGAPGDLARIIAEHRMLRESVENNPMPYAVYDAEDYLIACNKAYEQVHSDAFHRLRHLADARQLRYGDLVRITAESTLPPEQVEAHVAERVRRQREGDGAGALHSAKRAGRNQVTTGR